MNPNQSTTTVAPSPQPLPTPTTTLETPTLNPEVNPSVTPISPKSKLPIVFTIFLFLVIIGAVGLFIYQKLMFQNTLSEPNPTVSTKSSPTTESDTTSGWETYTNEEYGFSLKFPISWKNRYKVKILSDAKVTSLSFDFIGVTQNYKLFSINRMTEIVWKNFQSDEQFVGLSKYLGTYDKYVYYSQLSMDNPFTGSDGEVYQNLAININQIISTFKFKNEVDETIGWKEYQIKKAGLIFRVPSEYNVEINDTSKFGSTNAEKAYSFTIQDYPFNAPPPDNPFKLEVNYYFNDYSSTLNDSKKGLTSIVETTVAGLAAIQGNGYEASGGSSKKQFFYTYFIKDGGMFASQTSDVNIKNKKLTNKILSTFKFE
jgi:hypothetical protein